VLKGGITVTDKEDLAIKNVNPPFGAVASNTAITVFRDTMSAKMTKFAPTPRVYLNPAKSMNPPANAKAILLTSTSFVDGDTLTAVVPAGTPASKYDVIVVNPDPGNQVGVLLDGYTSVTDAPPVIVNVVPPSIVSAAGQVVELQGDDFRQDAKVTASCVDTNKMPVGAPPVTNGQPTCNGMGKACTMSAMIDASALMLGYVCVIRVANTDKTFGDFSAVGVTNASLNLQTPSKGTDMLVARRALGSAATKPTAAARFVYAIAGDDGTDAGTKDDVEAVSVDLFGTMGKSWFPLKYKLAGKRSFFGTAQSPRYVYVVGGSNGTAALATAERSQVLDPLEAPIIDDVDFSYDLAGLKGLLGGEWIYRVSAEYETTDPHNPAGEGLASDPFIIKIPSNAKLGVQIFWKAPVDCKGAGLANIKQYHIYRTPKAGDGSGKEEEIATVPGNQLSFTDDGSAMADPTKKPLLLGSTGKWASLPNLATERNGVAAAMAVDPTTPTSKRYLYALFGKNQAGTVLNNYQFLPITVDACGRETVGNAWTTGANTSTARTRHMVWVVDKSIRADVGTNTTLIYVGGGIDGTNNQVQSVFRATVSGTGDLGTFTNTTQDIKGGGVTGGGTLAAASQLFLFGGTQGNADNKGVSAKIESAAGALANNSWNAGLNLLTPRVFMGSSVQSAFAFFVGGKTDVLAATKGTELVVW
jgi:hypothetical protein